jgi:pimeloyl-ACP methyl ester carboxylesterase
MPVRQLNGISLNYEEYGAGEPVVFLPGSGTRGTVFRSHQVPALVAAGYRVITLDTRGVAPSDPCEQGYQLSDLVADAAALIETVCGGRCRIVGYSMGALVVQELLLEHPGLVTAAVLMATRGRTDELSAANTAAELELLEAGVKLPPAYQAVVRMFQGFSPRTLRDGRVVRDWLDLFELSATADTASRSQLELDRIPDRRPAYRAIRTPTLVLAFADDLLTCPELCREVADAIPGSRYQEIPDAGHFGYVEAPDAVNTAIIEFFRGD